MTSILLEDTHICFLIRGNLHFWTLFSEIGKFLGAEFENWQERQSGVYKKRTSTPSTKSFLIFGHSLVLKVS